MSTVATYFSEPRQLVPLQGQREGQPCEGWHQWWTSCFVWTEGATLFVNTKAERHTFHELKFTKLSSGRMLFTGRNEHQEKLFILIWP